MGSGGKAGPPQGGRGGRGRSVCFLLSCMRAGVEIRIYWIEVTRGSSFLYACWPSNYPFCCLQSLDGPGDVWQGVVVYDDEWVWMKDGVTTWFMMMLYDVQWWTIPYRRRPPRPYWRRPRPTNEKTTKRNKDKSRKRIRQNKQDQSELKKIENIKNVF